MFTYYTRLIRNQVQNIMLDIFLRIKTNDVNPKSKRLHLHLY